MPTKESLPKTNPGRVFVLLVKTSEDSKNNCNPSAIMITAPIIRRDNGTAISIYIVKRFSDARKILKIYDGDLLLAHQEVNTTHKDGLIITEEFKQMGAQQ